MNDNLWERKTDDELRNAALNLADYTSAGQESIISEMKKRGMDVPLPASPPTAPPWEDSSSEYVKYPVPVRIFGVVLTAAAALAVCQLIFVQLLAYLQSSRTGVELGTLIGTALGAAIGFQICRNGIRLAKGDRLDDLILSLKSGKKNERIKATTRLRKADAHLHVRIVPALLDALSDKEPKVVREITKTLSKLTGEPIGNTADEWIRWWQGKSTQSADTTRS